MRLTRETWVEIDVLNTKVNVMENELTHLSENSIINQDENRVKGHLDLHGNLLAIKKLLIDKKVFLNHENAEKVVKIDNVLSKILFYFKFDFYELFLNKLEKNAENAQEKERTKRKIRKIHNSLAVLSSVITFFTIDFPTIKQNKVEEFKNLLDEQAVKHTGLL